MSKHHDPYEDGRGLAGFFTGIARALAICALTISLLGLVGMGGILGLSHISDQPLQALSNTLDNFDLGTANDMRLPALWERLAVAVYTCASVAVLALVALFVIRTPKPTRHIPLEETA